MTAYPRPPAWVDLAACAEVGGDIWFPEQHDTGTAAKAVSVCRGCEARPRCLEYALDRPGTTGVWGGFTDLGRQAVARRYRAGVPVEDIIADADEVFYVQLDRSAEAAAAARTRKNERARAKTAAIALQQEELRKAS